MPSRRPEAFHLDPIVPSAAPLGRALAMKNRNSLNYSRNNRHPPASGLDSPRTGGSACGAGGSACGAGGSECGGGSAGRMSQHAVKQHRHAADPQGQKTRPTSSPIVPSAAPIGRALPMKNHNLLNYSRKNRHPHASGLDSPRTGGSALERSATGGPGASGHPGSASHMMSAPTPSMRHASGAPMASG
jgi:hypothetical protein